MKSLKIIGNHWTSKESKENHWKPMKINENQWWESAAWAEPYNFFSVGHVCTRLLAPHVFSSTLSSRGLPRLSYVRTSWALGRPYVGWRAGTSSPSSCSWGLWKYVDMQNLKIIADFSLCKTCQFVLKRNNFWQALAAPPRSSVHQASPSPAWQAGCFALPWSQNGYD